MAMSSRPFTPAELMTDRFDCAFTLNFTTIASVHGPLSQTRITHALRCLERRHPLLRARIDREAGASLVLGEAQEIPLRTLDVHDADTDTDTEARVLAESAAAMLRCVWEDSGPRAELMWLRHGGERSTLLLTLHHVVSDGTSGMLAMRDLLSFIVHAPELSAIAPLDSPGQVACFPPDHAAMRKRALDEVASGAKQMQGAPALRLSDVQRAAPSERRLALRRVRFTADASQRMVSRARQAGATVHGVLSAGLALAVAQERDTPHLQRIAHPVDLRRYLPTLQPPGKAIGDAVGYYVSSVDTEHTLDGSEALGDMARQISEAVRRKKEEGEPLRTAPVFGPMLVERTAGLDIDTFRAIAEQKVFDTTFGVTNLGVLEPLGLRARLADLTLDDLYFVASGSVLNQLGASAVSFDGRISLQLNCIDPLVAPEAFERVVQRTVAALQAFAC